MRESIKTASTREEAEALALAELGITRDRADVEVLKIEEKGFIFKKKIVTVKVSEKEEDFDVKAIFARAEKPAEEKKEVKPRQKAENKKQPKPEKKAQKARQKREEKTEKAEKTEITQDPVKDEPTEEVVLTEDEISEKVKYAMSFLKSVIDEFHEGEYELCPTKSEKGVTIKISGENMGTLIGKKGETMEALSYLTGLAANRSDDSEEKITVDVADYREKKEKDLVASAKKAAAKVLKTGRPFGFEPMSPYDRRIIHATISEIEGVRSESKGEGSQRRVMVYSTSPRPKKDGAKGRNSRGRNDRRGRRDDRPPQVQKTRDEKLVDVSSVGLYGKIEL
ncbi:MAG: KH domain-containing protein [Oscillospiraceae bacterium]|nr:KH domain-containing protein [Oscillospiraceae bacterium]